jgi:NADPH:quinone reductase-like Zn-dependent oxidoreductase
VSLIHPPPKRVKTKVLVKVHAASANALEYRRFEMQSLLGWVLDTYLLKAINKVLGADIAGTVETVGTAVTRFKPGDEVFGVAAGSLGGFAEYACARERSLVLKPAHVSFEQAAAVPIAALTALHGLHHKGQLQAGQKVLIYGASGGVGTFAVQIAKAFGAEVSAVCSTRNMDMVRSIGADYVIDYTKEDFAKNGQRYDLIMATNGYRWIFDYKRALSPGGTYVMAGGSIAQILQAHLLGRFISKNGSGQLPTFMTRINQEDLVVLKELLEVDKIVPVIDRSYPLSEVVAAIRYLIDEHARGKVVITMRN